MSEWRMEAMCDRCPFAKSGKGKALAKTLRPELLPILDAAIALKRLEACELAEIHHAPHGWFVRVAKNIRDRDSRCMEKEFLPSLTAALDAAEKAKS